MQRRAVIDIGTNSVKLLVGDVDGLSVIPIWEGSEQTRLGEGFYPECHLQSAAIARTAQAAARFAAAAKRHGAISVRAIATSAAREAKNQGTLLESVRKIAHLPVEVISGEQEAAWALLGVRTNPELASQPLLILDVGGGSTQVVLGRAEGHPRGRSFPIGGVRLLEQMRPSDPPESADWDRCSTNARAFIEEQIEPWLRMQLAATGADSYRLVGTGGTASMVAAIQLRLSIFDRERMEQGRFGADQLSALRKQLWSLTLEERRKLPGLPPNRADVILFGVAILSLIMERFHFREFQVSTRGLRFAALTIAAGKPN